MYQFRKAKDYQTFDEDCYYIWRFMVDQKYQNKGYERQMVEKVLQEIKEKPFGQAANIYTTYIRGNVVAKEVCESFGFIETDKIVFGDEHVAKRGI
jgi:diamine N-acetyltransferase